MEAIVKSAIQQFCEENNILKDFQHDFRRGRSSLSNLLACLEIWTRAPEEGFEVDVVYIDFRKAFDTVPHQRLFHKLSTIGIRGDLLNCIRAFLVGRKQRFCIEDDMSEWVNVTSVVPQGSVLGPVLFILYVNDRLQELDCGKIMFADNVKLWQVIKGPNDQRSLQGNLHRLQAWSKKWLLDFNVEKCAVLHLRPEELPTPSVSDILFSECIVRRELEALNESKSSGPDEIPSKLLKELASELSVPLSMLFQTSFDTGTLPMDWKLAHITPLHKGDLNPSSRRPARGPPSLHRLPEGFRHCATPKALTYAEKIGIGGNFLKWIENFLLGRHQVVCIGRGKSDLITVESVVPQGSVLGSVLFLIYVDDAARDLDCEVAMFADDMKIWSVLRGPAYDDRMQMNLNCLEKWSNRWLQRFSVAKCSILRLGNTARSASTRGYFLGGAALQEVEAQKDLGVMTTSSLKPSAHCSRVAKSAMSVLQQRGDLILVYKVMHDLEHGFKFEDMFQWHLSRNLRGHSMKLRTTMSRLNLPSENFPQRVVEQWNDLPQSLVEAAPLQLFKEGLDDYLCPLFSLDGLNLN
nr:unnamed protein product [Spirometra erinaceieuropaei]